MLRHHGLDPAPRRTTPTWRAFLRQQATGIPLEQLTVPTLVISAKDDHLAPHRFAVDAAARIPGARFVAINSGGHLLLGRKAEVQKEVSAFVAPVLANETD